MTIAEHLESFLRHGIHRIGEIEIQTPSPEQIILSHETDRKEAAKEGHGQLEIHRGPEAARDLSTYAEDGTYRFTKGQVNLRRGWVMVLSSIQDLRLALDQFYPASVGLWIAHQSNALEVQNLRDKLERQTGMYRSARFISTAGAQELVKTVCGPAHQCAKRILWRIDPETPLEESEASQFNGISSGLPETEAIPLLCQEACNHFVSECRKVSKAEHDIKKSNG
jgi:hypothetical protein